MWLRLLDWTHCDVAVAVEVEQGRRVDGCDEQVTVRGKALHQVQIVGHGKNGHRVPVGICCSASLAESLTRFCLAVERESSPRLLVSIGR